MTKIDELLTEGGFSNHDLVEQDPLHLNHKMVQKARLGKKPIPKHSQELITAALNMLLQPESKISRRDLFPEQNEQGV